MAIRRTTLAAEADDLAQLEQEAERRGISLARLLREIVAAEASSLRMKRRPRFGLVRTDAQASRLSVEDEESPARSPFQS